MNGAMNRLNLHLVSDSTGETLEMIAKAALAQFDNPSVNRHFWPMVRSLQHLDRIVPDLAAHPGLVLYTLVNPETRGWRSIAATLACLPYQCWIRSLPLSRHSSGKRRMVALAAST
jgi:regulator of PEP synthase PpsR (kinase-PPPase family)